MSKQYIIGIPKETKHGEHRVPLVPNDIKIIKTSVIHCTILVETDAGTLAGFSDQDYIDVGAIICQSKQELYERANIIVKVKEPNQNDLPFLTDKHILFCYLHLAAFPLLTKELLDKKVLAIAFESITETHRYGKTTLPLLTPMSTVAGKLAVHMAHDVLRSQLGELITSNTNVHIVGAGNVGFNAAEVALGLGAKVKIYDTSESKLETIESNTNLTVMPNLTDNPTVLEEQLLNSTNDISIVICGALVRDDKAPKLISKEMLEYMNKTQFRPTVFVDVSIDQGGCIEGIIETNLSSPWYKQGKHYFIAVPNMPGSVSHTSSILLSTEVWPYVATMVDRINTDTLYMNDTLVAMFESINTGIVLREGKIVNDTLKSLYGSRGENIK